MTSRALEILDARITEVSRQSEQHKRRGDFDTMYKLNTAYHWLAAARAEIAHANGELSGEKKP